MKAIQIEYDKYFEKRCRLVSEAGFEYIAIVFGYYMEDTSDKAFDEAPQKISEILKKYNLKVVQTHAYYYDLLISSEIIDEDSERQILRAIEVTGKLGVPWCVYHPRAHSTDGYSKELSLEDNIKSVSRYLEQAEKYNTGIALENLFSWAIFTMYGCEYEDLATLCDSFESERVKICWDFGHANLQDFKQEDAIKYLGSRICCTHVHSNYGDKNDYHLVPDRGSIDWKTVLATLKEINYDGPLTLETHLDSYDLDLLKGFYNYNYCCISYLEKLM